MTSDQLLILILGLVVGFAFGWLTKWREDRKLEHHGVKLWQWDRPIDFSATPDNAVPFTRQSQR